MACDSFARLRLAGRVLLPGPAPKLEANAHETFHGLNALEGNRRSQRCRNSGSAADQGSAGFDAAKKQETDLALASLAYRSENGHFRSCCRQK